MVAPTPSLNWSSQLSIAASSETPTSLTGDKILLPQSALEQLLAASASAPRPSPVAIDVESWDAPQEPQQRHQQLPHPLIFKLYNPANNRFSHAVPREFSAAEGEVGISPFLREALGLEDKDEEALGEGELEGTRPKPKITIVSKSLPKGTHVRLRPLEAGYDDEDWKALLERHLRMHFTTLTVGEILSVSGSTNSRGKGDRGDFRFLIDKLEPEEAVCIVDTDLEVDIEPLSEEQARETLKQRIARSTGGASTGGIIKIDEPVKGQVLPGDYHFYELKEWKRDLPLTVELDGVEDGDEVDIFVSTSKQHRKPHDDEHVWGDFGSSYPKRIEIAPTNIEIVDVTTLSFGIHGYRTLDAGDDEESEDESTRPYVLRITQSVSSDHMETDTSTNDGLPPGPDYKKCNNCTQWIPARTFMLHENFCLRNNHVCKKCKQVFKRGTESQHWHCTQCNAHGINAPAALEKHVSIFHHPRHCTSCPYEAANLPDLAVHKTTTCPERIILCKFCHLLVPQDGEGDGSQPNAEIIMTGLSKHELECGSRTTDCHLCSRITKLRDMESHLKNHDLQRLSKNLPRICRNSNCARTLKNTKNDLGLCEFCYGPLYAQSYDPTGSQLKRRVERKLLQQLLTGCGKSWCQNDMCKSGLENRGVKSNEPMSTAKAFPIIKPISEKLLDTSVPLSLCVDETTKKRREMAEWMCAESALQEAGGYDLAFTIAAVENATGDRGGAWKWLEREGVRSGERRA